MIYKFTVLASFTKLLYPAQAKKPTLNKYAFPFQVLYFEIRTQSLCHGIQKHKFRGKTWLCGRKDVGSSFLWLTLDWLLSLRGEKFNGMYIE